MQINTVEDLRKVDLKHYQICLLTDTGLIQLDNTRKLKKFIANNSEITIKKHCYTQRELLIQLG
jgi:hypothetical protein